jgi:uncharacterized membrane protein YhiD involved in acid resistance
VIYRLSHGRDRAATTGLVTTLVLLAVLIALVSIVIGSSVARAFSLVGALSIVRFRTVVEDTRDTAFVIFTVVVGMAAGAGLFWVAPLGLLVVGLAAVLLSHLWDLPTTDVDRSVPGKLMVRVAMGQKPVELVDPVLKRYCDQHHIHETSLWKQGTGLELIYVVRLRHAEDLPQVVVDLSQTEGILGVELKRS